VTDVAAPPRIPELVVVDFAGTTLHENGAVLAAYREALTAEGIPFSEAELAARRGANKRAVFEELAARNGAGANGQEVAARALATFEAALHREYTSGPVAEIPGAAAAIRLLRQHGIRVALTSGFERSLVTLLVGRLGWAMLFDLVLAGDDVPLGRPAPFLIYRALIELCVPNVANVAVVGDTPLDLQAATAAHAGWAIGVLSGAHGIETLSNAPHTHLIPSIAVLPQLFGLSATGYRLSASD
jgi:phosphonatase-like hydrolase